MASPFLHRFADDLVAALVERKLIELEPGTLERVSVYVANHLGRKGAGGSLLSSTLAALFECPEVVDVYCDDEELKGVMEALRYPT